MYNLSDFAFSDMVDCGAKLRRIASGAGSMEAAAQRVVSYLYGSLRDDAGDPACALVRCFVTHPFDELEPELQQFATAVLGRDPEPRTKSLTLLATAGQEPAWNDRRRSVAHRAIPLAGEQLVAQSPMIFQLITQFGLEVGTLLEPEPELILDLEQRTYNVFHVAEAAGSPFVPAQETFVAPFGVRSVLGFGGVLPGGNLVAFILFARCPIKAETASLFKTLALAAKLALMPFAHGPVLSPERARSSIDDDGPETLRARLAALEQLLDVYETVAAQQARKLEQALAQLQTADERFRALAQNSSDLITVVDRHNRITYQSPSLVTVLGYPPDSLQGEDWYVLVHPDDVAAVREHLSAVAAATPPAGGSGEARLRHADGSWRHTEIRSENLLSNPSIAGVVLNVRDISERRKAELAVALARDEAVEASRAKSDFLAVMSHEIRTPMNGVIGLTGLLLDGPLSETQRHHAEGVRASGEALLGIINDILDFSKIEAGKLELETVTFDLAQALDDVAGLVAESARAKALELVVDCPPDLPKALRGDVGRLRQILLNLATNAVKFTEAGEVVLRARLADRSTADGTVVRLEVTDTGIGIDAATAARIFDPFSQADPSTTRRYGGTGLGLAICRRLAEAMGGSIGMESRPGEGARFWVELPFTPAAEDAGGPDRAARALRGRRALVVDDNQTNRLVLTTQLQAWEITADAVTGGEPALARLREAGRRGTPYDLALLDMHMPGMDGLELARTITADPDLRATRLLLLSSVPVEADAVAGSGFVARLTKPVRLGSLHEALLGAVGSVVVQRQGVVTPAVATHSKGTLLVVEDHAINQEVAKGMLSKLGYRCDVAGDGVEALAALDRRSYDAILMDCRMHRMDGFEATAAIRRREGEGRRVPIIAMTASAQLEDRERCMAVGMDDYLSKPVKERDLAVILGRWLSPAGGGPPPADGTPPPEAGGVLDQEQLARLHEVAASTGDPGFLARLVARFTTEVDEQLAAIQEAIDHGDAPALRSAAHGLKGSAGTMGAAEVAARCETLERIAAAGGLPPSDAVSLLAAALDEAVAALQAEVPATGR